jgi:methionyl-tRNA formyltransferase
LRIVFAGTPEFAATVLTALLASAHELRAVYTQPDRPAGRGRALKAGAVKAIAVARGIDLRQPQSVRGPEAAADLAALAPDLLVVAAYGLLLPRTILDVPRHGCVNVHASMLPRWRGAAPIERAIAAGDTETGVTIMRMVEALDAGPVLAQRSCAIAPTDTGGSLRSRLAAIGADLLVETLDAMARGPVTPRAQDDGAATYARKIDKSETRLDWRDTAGALARKVRAFDPTPVAVARLGDRELRVWGAEALDEAAAAGPGTLIAATAAGLDVATAAGVLRITRLQEPGRNPVAARDFVNAHRDWLAKLCHDTPP